MKYLAIIIVSAALLTAAIIATGGQLDVGSVLAILVAACLPAGMAYEYRADLWPHRPERETTVTAPEVESVAVPVALHRRFPTLLAWHRPVPTMLAPTVIERPNR